MRSRNGTGQIAPCWVCSRTRPLMVKDICRGTSSLIPWKKNLIICCNLLMKKILGSLIIVRVITIPSPNGISHPQIVLYALELSVWFMLRHNAYFVCNIWAPSSPKSIFAKGGTSILSVRIQHLKWKDLELVSYRYPHKEVVNHVPVSYCHGVDLR